MAAIVSPCIGMHPPATRLTLLGLVIELRGKIHGDCWDCMPLISRNRSSLLARDPTQCCMAGHMRGPAHRGFTLVHLQKCATLTRVLESQSRQQGGVRTFRKAEG
jgi:hypothetical protein